MYCEYFGLKEYPFSITPDTSYFFTSTASKQGLNTLLVATEMGEGFIKVVGEIGTGKTLLCRKLIDTLQQRCKVAYIPNPYLSPAGLIEEIAIELGIHTEDSPPRTPHQMLRELNAFLIAECQRGGKVVICLDETQSMPVESLEVLRLLSNLETGKRKLVQVILFGQPELDDKLAQPDIRQLRQRISFEYYLSGLSKLETARYIGHRLVVSGHRGPPLFSGPALWLLHRATRGVPRLINLYAHKALLSAYGKGKRQIGLPDVLASIIDTRSPRKARTSMTHLLGLLLACSSAWLSLGGTTPP